MPIEQSRRRFVGQLGIAGVAAMGGLVGAGLSGGAKTLAAEPPPEVTTIRFGKDAATCIAPQAVQGLLRAEGFTDIRYVDVTKASMRRAEAAKSGPFADMIAHDEIDLGRDFAPSLILGMDAGAPVTLLSGLHLGCFDVWAKSDVHGLLDLKGRTVGFAGPAASVDKIMLRIMLSLVGLDPDREVDWVTSTESGSPMDLFFEGKIDAFLAVPPFRQELIARNIGHAIFSSVTDRPWSQYYCCYLTISTKFVDKYPVATKRVLRAILKATDLCASQPALMAQLLVEQGYTTRFDYAFKELSELRYDVWRDYDPEDTLLFYGLKLHEAGLIKSSPQELIAAHTDWRFLNELKRELKG
jgi:NitT/TauT family transport system substrate-binding protein